MQFIINRRFPYCSSFLAASRTRSSSLEAVASTATLTSMSRNSTQQSAPSFSSLVFSGSYSSSRPSTFSSSSYSSSSSPLLFKPTSMLLQAAETVTGGAAGGGGPPFYCPLCNRKFKTQVGLGDHIKDKHAAELQKAQVEQQQQQQQQVSEKTTPADTSKSSPSIDSPPPPAAAAVGTEPSSPSSGTTTAAAAAAEVPPPVTQIYMCEHCKKRFKSTEACMTHIKDKHRDLLMQAATLREEKMKEKLKTQEQQMSEGVETGPE